MTRQRDLVPYICLDCGKQFETQFRRIFSTGNRCSPCKTRHNNKQRIYGPASPESAAKMSAAHAGKPGYWKGKTFSETHRANLSRSRKGVMSPQKGIRRIPADVRNLRESVHDCCSGMVRRVLAIKNERKVRKTFQYLGYTKSDFINHIASKFQSGMSWGNYGEWHVDHVIPVAVFVRRGITDVAVINSLDNLQPLWKIDNLKKGDRIKCSMGKPPT